MVATQTLSEEVVPDRILKLRLAGAAGIWLALYLLNERLWDWLFDDVAGLDLTERGVGAAHFFLYDTAKIALLLLGLLFAVGMVNTAISPERVRDALAGRRLASGLVLAVVLGSVTPFCSCSSVPLFIGLVAAGVPLSITLAFLIASPLISETAIIMMGGTFGWGTAALWAGLGGALALVAGAVIHRLDLERWVEPFVFESATVRLARAEEQPTLAERVEASRSETQQILATIWPYVIGGIAIGAAIHGWVPDGFFENVAGGDSPLAVVAATVLGVPLYANPAGVVPLAEALHAKGTALGTTMAFTMSVVALSPPSLIMLRRVLKPPLLALFTAIVATGIVIIGIVVNLLT
jgi:uncharacterized membrane protein YraQ (UPF0718 family)